jgi:hypothetical protein
LHDRELNSLRVHVPAGTRYNPIGLAAWVQSIVRSRRPLSVTGKSSKIRTSEGTPPEFV